MTLYPDNRSRYTDHCSGYPQRRSDIQDADSSNKCNISRSLIVAYRAKPREKSVGRANWGWRAALLKEAPHRPPTHIAPSIHTALTGTNPPK